jgi:hypothetical protein
MDQQKYLLYKHIRKAAWVVGGMALALALLFGMPYE